MIAALCVVFVGFASLLIACVAVVMAGKSALWLGRDRLRQNWHEDGRGIRWP